MSDWQVGDPALCVGGGGSWAADGGPPKGSINPVDDMVVTPDWTALVFDKYPSPHWTRGWISGSFRKVRPDAHEACETAFVVLLKRSKRSVNA